MADKEISALTAAGTLNGTELVHGVQSSNSRKILTQEIADLREVRLTVEEETGTSYTAVSADNRKWKEMNNAAAITVTIDNSVHTAGDELTFEQHGAGVVTFAAGAGFTLNSRGALLSTNGQYAVASIKFKSASEGILFGDLV